MRLRSPAAATAVSVILTGRLTIAVAQENLQCTQGRIDPSDSNVDRYQIKPRQTYADFFRVEYPGDSSKTVWTDNLNVYSNADRKQQKHFLRQCGSDLEPDPNDPLYVTGTGRQTIIELPVQNYIVTSTTQIPYLTALGQTDKVKVYIGDPKYVSEPCFAEKMELEDGDPGLIKVISSTELFMNMTTKGNSQFDQSLYDLVIEDHSTVTLGGCPIYGLYGGDESQCDAYPNLVDMMGWSEPTPQGRMEYLELIASFANKESRAQKLTKRKENRWDCIDRNIEWWNREVDFENGAIELFAREDLPKVKVAWLEWAGYKGFDWGDKCAEKNEDDTEDQYYCRMAKSCAVDLIGQEADDPDPFDIAANMKKLNEADIVVYGHYFRELDDSPEAREVKAAFQESTPYKNVQFFDVTKHGEFTWFEDRIFNYEILLEDFCYIAGRHSKFFQHMTRYLRNVQREPEGSSGYCKMVSKYKKSPLGPKISCDYVEANGLCKRYKSCQTVPGKCQFRTACNNKLKACKRLAPFTDGRSGRNKKNTCASKKARVLKNCARQCGECCRDS